jgi:hypothetical protein
MRFLTCRRDDRTAAQVELESIVRANTLLGVLKAEAHPFLAHAKPS